MSPVGEYPAGLYLIVYIYMYVVCPLNVDWGWLLFFETGEILITSSYRVVKVISFTYLPADGASDQPQEESYI